MNQNIFQKTKEEKQKLKEFKKSQKERKTYLKKEMSYDIVLLDKGPNIYKGENELDDNFPVYGDYYYTANGHVIRSDVFGTVKDLKRDLYNYEKSPVKGIKKIIIRNCNIYKREKK